MTSIILASSSPRRRELLSNFNINTVIVKPNVGEKVLEGEAPEQVAMSLSFEKASEVAKVFSNGEIILGADTIVWCDGKILGKPKDEDEAMEMIKFLNNKEHEVITGLCLIKAGTNLKIIDYERTIVKFRNLSYHKIERYIKTKEYADKAGAYGIQGYGSLLVEYIRGCYFNIVGLPIAKLDYLLDKYFNVSLL
ncbi:MAG TPA: septum formation protein Maf [Tissierellia bacterium]|nr:septum formation protein Maf [Tissierellia bacterium]